jgi:hypothetical protein
VGCPNATACDSPGATVQQPHQRASLVAQHASLPTPIIPVDPTLIDESMMARRIRSSSLSTTVGAMIALCGRKGPIPRVTVKHRIARARRMWFEFFRSEQDAHA